MFLKKTVDRFNTIVRSLAFRLTLWYGGIFTVSAVVTFLFFYLLITNLFRGYTDQELTSQAGGFAAMLDAGGIEAVKPVILNLFAKRLSNLPDQEAAKDPKSRLQEALQAVGLEDRPFLADRFEVPEGWAASLDLFLGELEDAILLEPEQVLRERHHAHAGGVDEVALGAFGQ